jgi:hypothetical protein
MVQQAAEMIRRIDSIETGKTISGEVPANQSSLVRKKRQKSAPR